MRECKPDPDPLTGNESVLCLPNAASVCFRVKLACFRFLAARLEPAFNNTASVPVGSVMRIMNNWYAADTRTAGGSDQHDDCEGGADGCGGRAPFE